METSGQPLLNLAPGMIVLIAAFDAVLEHEFEILDVLEDSVCGHAPSGPRAGEYGGPEIKMIPRMARPG